MSAVPEDLADWFETGSTCIDRFGMERFSFRYRVVRVGAYSEGGPMQVGDRVYEQDPHVYGAEIREFKTLKGAEACAERWRNERPDRPVIVQTAVIFWMTEDETAGPIAKEQERRERIWAEARRIAGIRLSS